MQCRGVKHRDSLVVFFERLDRNEVLKEFLSCSLHVWRVY